MFKNNLYHYASDRCHNGWKSFGDFIILAQGFSITILWYTSVNGTIDAVVFGGKKGQEYKYKESIDFISQILFKELSFQPTIMTGPNTKIEDGSTNVYLDTQNRRLYIVRPHQKSEVNEDYLPSELEKKSKDW